MHQDIAEYNSAQDPANAKICDRLAARIEQSLPEAQGKIWHAHPVWFIDGNPIVGYGKLADGVRLLFWSGQSFKTPGLAPEGKFKAAEVRFASPDQLDAVALDRWLAESRDIQWDYKNVVKRKGKLERVR
jgi:hypothetical protein